MTVPEEVRHAAAELDVEKGTFRGTTPGLDRRQVLKGGLVAGAGLLLGLRLPRAVEARMGAAAGAPLNAFVRIAPDGAVTVLSKHIEFGQGTYTGLATILAEELDADWTTVSVESAPADVTRYANLAFGAQGTGGSTAMANSWEQMRTAGATARAMLVAAAAARWEVPAAEIEVENGVVRHAGSGRSAGFGELAEAAAAIEPPAEVELKDPASFRLIGREDLARIDVPAKAHGTARYTIDVRRPEMLTAVVAHPPRFGGKAAEVDDSKARKVPGVVSVVVIPRGVAVLAESFWAAKRGRDALEVTWDESAAETRGSAELLAEFQGLLDEPGLSARRDGDPGEALAGAATTLAADYDFPYLAHAPMEPLDCVIEKTADGGCQLWAGSQLQTIDQMTVAGILGVEPQKVKIETMLGGGSFGRRATPDADIASEAATILAATGGDRPVKVVWTREDDLRGGRYRPLTTHRLEAGLDADGKLVAWRHRIAGQSIIKGTAFEPALIRNGVDSTSVEGARGLPYIIPNLGVELHSPDVGVPVLWWRSVGHTHNGFTTETFLDEVAHAAGRDPVELRRELLAESPRHLGVLELAAERAGWGSPLAAGRFRGVAVHESFASYVAQVVEITVGEDRMPKVERVVCAVDCGMPINPDNIRAQMEGGIGYGLGAALHNEIILEGGRVRESNFHDYRPLRIQEMPEIEVVIVPSKESPTGVGEPGVPPIAPAVANAYFAATGRRIRKLPFRRAIAEEVTS